MGKTFRLAATATATATTTTTTATATATATATRKRRRSSATMAVTEPTLDQGGRRGTLRSPSRHAHQLYAVRIRPPRVSRHAAAAGPGRRDVRVPLARQGPAARLQGLRPEDERPCEGSVARGGGEVRAPGALHRVEQDQQGGPRAAVARRAPPQQAGAHLRVQDRRALHELRVPSLPGPSRAGPQAASAQVSRALQVLHAPHLRLHE